MPIGKEDSQIYLSEKVWYHLLNLLLQLELFLVLLFFKST